MVAWPKRLEREAPLLREVLSRSPHSSVLDLGSGTGEHARYFADQNYNVVGIDLSTAVIEEARRETSGENPRFFSGDIRHLDTILKGEESFGAAFCLGNTLVHLTSEEDLARTLQGLSQFLQSGGLFLLQILNYHRIFEQGIRHLPVNFTSQSGHEIVFLRLMELGSEGRVVFCPTTLRFDPSLDCPVAVIQSRRVELRGWRQKELEKHLLANGFEVVSLFGDMRKGGFDPDESSDLIVLARRQTI